MNVPSEKPRDPARRRRARRRLWIGIALAGIAGGTILTVRHARPGRTDSAGPALFEVQRGPLTISITESGSIQSQDKVIVRTEVEGRNTVLWVVDEGKSVQKDDLLIELDASRLSESRIEQQIKLESAESLMIQSRENMDIVRNQAQSDLDDAELTLKFALLEKEKFEKGEYIQQLQQAEAAITIANEELARAKEKTEWSKRLMEQGYLTRTEYQADELSSKRAQLDLDLANGKLRLLTEYTYKQTIEKLASDIRKAERALERTRRKSAANIVQAEAEMKARDAEYTRMKAKLDKVVEQIAKCRIVAPADGMVVYATSVRDRRWGEEPLKAGVEVVERADLIYLPATKNMMAVVQIQEASLPKIRVGQLARVRVDALPGRLFVGRLERIGILPNSGSSWMNPDLKLYDCEVYLSEGSAALRPGMSCRVEILIEEYEDAVYVPVQCVMQVNNAPTVYVRGEEGEAPRPVETGLDNNRMVRIVSGLRKGEKVLLNPPLPPSSMQQSSAGDEARENGNGRRDRRPEGAPRPDGPPKSAGGGGPPAAAPTPAPPPRPAPATPGVPGP